MYNIQSMYNIAHWVGMLNSISLKMIGIRKHPFDLDLTQMKKRRRILLLKYYIIREIELLEKNTVSDK